MDYVKKNNPSVPVGNVSATIKSRLLSRDEYSNKLVLDFMAEAREQGYWIICDCRDDVEYEFMPGMSVVLRSGHYHLRNLPTRESHNKDCPFLYFKSAIWDQGGDHALTKQKIEHVSLSSWLEVNPAHLFFLLLEESGWSGYMAGFNFLDLIRSLQQVAERFVLEGKPVSDRLCQSPSKLLTFLSEAKASKERSVSVFVFHEFDASRSRFDRDDGVYIQFKNGALPLYGAKQDTLGPFLVMAIYSEDGEPDFGAYIPVAARHSPVPVFSNAERKLCLSLIGYLEWLAVNLSTGDNHLTVSKAIDSGVSFEEGFIVSTNERSVRVIIDTMLPVDPAMPVTSYSVEDNAIYIREGVFAETDSQSIQEWSLPLKRSLREVLELV